MELVAKLLYCLLLLQTVPVITSLHCLLLYLCCVCACWGSHVIATQPVHWRAGGCQATALCLFFLFRDPCLETYVVSEPFASYGCFSDSTVHVLRKYTTICRWQFMDLSASPRGYVWGRWAPSDVNAPETLETSLNCYLKNGFRWV
jgi:hypothetical protein